MNCINCGQPLTEGAKFCSNCGTYVENHDKRTCPVCGEVLAPSTKFCVSCGAKIEQTTPSPYFQPQPAPQWTVISYDPVNDALAEFEYVTFYEGISAFSLALAGGTLSVYSDRIEFKRQFSKAFIALHGVYGMYKANKKEKKEYVQTDIYPYSRIRDIKEGRHGLFFKTVAITLNDGTEISFCPVLSVNSINVIINIIRQYL